MQMEKLDESSLGSIQIWFVDVSWCFRDVIIDI